MEAHRLFRIALAWHTLRRSGSDAVNGIAVYAEQFGPWQFFLNQIGDFNVLELARRNDLDGLIIFRDFDPEWNDIRWPSKIPIVSVEHVLSPFTPYQVLPDYRAIGSLVAEDFLERGYRRLVYCPRTDLRDRNVHNEWDHEQREGFVAAARGGDAEVLNYPDISSDSLREVYDPPIPVVANWFKSLQRPAAIMAGSDVRAHHVLLAAEAVGIRVPDDLAVVGVHNEPWTSIALRGVSSVEIDDYRAGYLAAQMLHRLLLTQPVEPKIVRVPPRRLVTRRSSDAFAIDDPEVAAAVRFIGDHANSPIEVQDLVKALAVSRRSIELRFRRVRKRSIQQEIRLSHIGRAKMLLRDESIPLARVASMAGFVSLKAMDAMFHRIVGMTPAAMRAKISASPNVE